MHLELTEIAYVKQCAHYDADVGKNFNRDVRLWAAEISGTRAAGDLTLTTRGLNAAKDLIKEMTEEEF